MAITLKPLGFLYKFGKLDEANEHVKFLIRLQRLSRGIKGENMKMAIMLKSSRIF